MRGTGKSAKRKSKPPPALEDARQFQRFVETAKKLGVDEGVEAFERAMKAVAPAARHRASTKGGKSDQS